MAAIRIYGGGEEALKARIYEKKRERKRKSSRRKIDRGSEEGLRGVGGREIWSFKLNIDKKKMCTGQRERYNVQRKNMRERVGGGGGGGREIKRNVS